MRVRVIRGERSGSVRRDGRVHGTDVFITVPSASVVSIFPLSLFIWKKLLFIHSWRIRTRDARRAVWSLFGKWCYSDPRQRNRASGRERGALDDDGDDDDRQQKEVK